MTIAVRIAATGFNDASGRTIVLFDPSQHFAVVLTNTGASPIRLWRETCSWGYANLSFEATDPSGARTSVTRKPIVWEKDHPDYMIVPPGDHMVIDVAFDATTWKNAPLPKQGEHRTVNLRAVYESGPSPEAKTDKVWTGKVVSADNAYTIFR